MVPSRLLFPQAHQPRAVLLRYLLLQLTEAVKFFESSTSDLSLTFGHLSFPGELRFCHPKEAPQFTHVLDVITNGLSVVECQNVHLLFVQNATVC